MVLLPSLNRRLRRWLPALAAASLLLPVAFPSPAAAPRADRAAVAPEAAERQALRQRIDAAREGIANLHRKSNGTLDCAKCHAGNAAALPDDNQTVENRECVSCHGGYREMAAESAKKLANAALNPHASHLGPEIACTSCHQGHRESKAYCLNCHTNFTMPMPGNAARAAR